MKLVIDIPVFTDEAEDSDIILRRRLLSQVRTDLQIAGFQCTVVGVVVAEDCPGDQIIMAVEPVEGS